MHANTHASKTLTTAHSSKGLEWDSVLLADDFPDLTDEFELMQNSKQEHVMTPLEFEQELNLFYVAVTRARSKLKDCSPNNWEYAKTEGEVNRIFFE